LQFTSIDIDGDLIRREFNMTRRENESGDRSLIITLRVHIMCINKARIEIIIQNVVNLITKIEIFVDRYYEHHF